jgi:hypothetical protein
LDLLNTLELLLEIIDQFRYGLQAEKTAYESEDLAFEIAEDTAHAGHLLTGFFYGLGTFLVAFGGLVADLLRGLTHIFELLLRRYLVVSIQLPA